MRMEYRGFEERSGKLNEFFLLGEIKTDDKKYTEASRLCLGMRYTEKLKCALDLVKEYQPFDPLNPKKPFLRDLREKIANALELSPEDSKKLRIYTSVNSILDLSFGVDALVEYEDKEGKAQMVTFDASINQQKVADKDSIKADVLIDDIPDPFEDKKGYQDKLSSLGTEVAKILKTRKSVV